ncbi:DUF1376 domain-containing protein [Pseudogemmobacter sonorensis]|uniref:DUF1376 domain-containing protein n=1 Tax=Pseudogemmobacter sonorensis TaxID=2989681 RepID=UPI003688DD43
MTLPYYPRYTRNFLDATTGWSLELKGAYSIILDLIYLHDGDLPDDPHFIAGNLGCSVRKWNQIRADLIARKKLILRLSQDNLGIISNKRADKEAEKLRRYEKKQRENGAKAHENKGIASAIASPTAPASAMPPHIPTGGENKDIDIDKKEEEGARAREAISGFSEEAAAGPAEPDPPPEPPPDPPPETPGLTPIPAGLLDDIRHALGIQPHEVGTYWSDPSLSEHARAWLDLPLAPDRIVAEAKASRARHPDPPDGPKALDRWMAQAAKASKSAAAVRPGRDTPAKASKPPSSPEDRLKFFADWVNGARPLPGSAISSLMRDALVEKGLVTIERLRERGIR